MDEIRSKELLHYPALVVFIVIGDKSGGETMKRQSIQNPTQGDTHTHVSTESESESQLNLEADDADIFSDADEEDLERVAGGRDKAIEAEDKHHGKMRRKVEHIMEQKRLRKEIDSIYDDDFDEIDDN